MQVFILRIPETCSHRNLVRACSCNVSHSLNLGSRELGLAFSHRNARVLKIIYFNFVLLYDCIFAERFFSFFCARVGVSKIQSHRYNTRVFSSSSDFPSVRQWVERRTLSKLTRHAPVDKMCWVITLFCVSITERRREVKVVKLQVECRVVYCTWLSRDYGLVGRKWWQFRFASLVGSEMLSFSAAATALLFFLFWSLFRCRAFRPPQSDEHFLIAALKVPKKWL